jgi:hypothetical protein
VNNTQDVIQIQNINKDNNIRKEDFYKNSRNDIVNEVYKIEEQITNGLAIHLIYNYCHEPVLGKPKVLKFADLERFFVAIYIK